MQVTKHNTFNYTGKTIISTSYMRSDCHNKAVVYICGHDHEGAMGLIVNKPIPNLTITNFLKKLKILFPADINNVPLLFGGTSEVTRGFILHSTDCMVEDSHKITNTIAITSTVDLLKQSLYSEKPKNMIMCLGCMIWGKDDLEDQITANMWIPMESDEKIIFSADNSTKWEKCLKSTGASSKILIDNIGYV